MKILNQVSEVLTCSHHSYSAAYYMFKVNNRNTRTRCEICSKLTINTPERCQSPRSVVFIVNFKHASYLVAVFLSLTLSKENTLLDEKV